MIIVAKIVDAGRLPNGVERTVMKRWAALPGETLNRGFLTVASRMHCVPCKFGADRLENPITRFAPRNRRRDRLLLRTARAGDIQVCHLPINPRFS